MELKVRIKKLCKDAIIPTYAKNGDAGMDLTAVDYYYDADGCIVYKTGLAIEIPEGFVGLVFPRSSVSVKDLLLTNCVGVIDSGYRGEILAKFKPVAFFEPIDVTEFELNKFKACARVHIPQSEDEEVYENVMKYNVGERIAQLIIMPYPQIEFEEVEELTQTERGDGGFGSSGK